MCKHSVVMILKTLMNIQELFQPWTTTIRVTSTRKEKRENEIYDSGKYGAEINVLMIPVD